KYCRTSIAILLGLLWVVELLEKLDAAVHGLGGDRRAARADGAAGVRPCRERLLDLHVGEGLIHVDPAVHGAAVNHAVEAVRKLQLDAAVHGLESHRAGARALPQGR